MIRLSYNTPWSDMLHATRTLVGGAVVIVAGGLFGQVPAPDPKLSAPAAEQSQARAQAGLLARIELLEKSLRQLVPAGTIAPYAGELSKDGKPDLEGAPDGWALCIGQEVPKVGKYNTLYQAIGDAYGTAKEEHFRLPDYRGMFLRGVTLNSNSDPDHKARAAMHPGGVSGNLAGTVQGDAVAKHTHEAGNLFATIHHADGIFHVRESTVASWERSGTVGGKTNEGKLRAIINPHTGDPILAGQKQKNLPRVNTQTEGTTILGSTGLPIPFKSTEAATETRPKNVTVYYLIKL